MGKPKSHLIEDKPNFLKRLQECPATAALFSQLRDKALRICGTDDWGYSDKPDFRIGCRFNMIELVPTPAHVLVMLRVDDQWPNLDVGELRAIRPAPAQEQGKPGRRWIEWLVTDDQQIDESIALIKAVYHKRKRTGWG